ncbi:MAG: HAD family hydrolase [Candidatus Rifleibacteriota bacterium]
MKQTDSDLIVLSDLGGVLIDLNWESSARKLFGKSLQRHELLSHWLSLQSVKEFEAGQCDFGEFHRAFCQETGSWLPLKDFEKEFLSIIGPVKPDCIAIMEELKRHYRLAMLSNTNHRHIDLLRNQTSLLECFDELFLSYRMHLIKPDPMIFRKVCEQLNTVPEKVFFFDDSLTNVTAAQNEGLHAWQVNSPGEILEIMSADRRLAQGDRK